MRKILGVLVATLLLLALGGTATASAKVEPLPRGTHADYQLGGPRAVPGSVGIVARDRTARPAPGRYNICYVNGFQTQPDEKSFWLREGRSDLILKKGGRAVVDEAWGEFLLDLRSASKRERLTAIMGRWVDGCARRGFDAVEFDNLDSYTRSDDLLTRNQALAYARLLVARTHRAGLAVGQKNLADLDGTRLGYDFAVTESCAQYAECWRFVRSYGSQVVMVEYRRADFDKACERYGRTHPVVLRDLDLSPSYAPTYC